VESMGPEPEVQNGYHKEHRCYFTTKVYSMWNASMLYCEAGGVLRAVMLFCCKNVYSMEQFLSLLRVVSSGILRHEF
jgi:hypothetical protein